MGCALHLSGTKADSTHIARNSPAIVFIRAGLGGWPLSTTSNTVRLLASRQHKVGRLKEGAEGKACKNLNIPLSYWQHIFRPMTKYRDVRTLIKACSHLLKATSDRALRVTG